jgi:hypothetical protein
MVKGIKASSLSQVIKNHKKEEDQEQEPIVVHKQSSHSVEKIVPK